MTIGQNAAGKGVATTGTKHHKLMQDYLPFTDKKLPLGQFYRNFLETPKTLFLVSGNESSCDLHGRNNGSNDGLDFGEEPSAVLDLGSKRLTSLAKDTRKRKNNPQLLNLGNMKQLFVCSKNTRKRLGQKRYIEIQ
jgi:hypothetical protein